MKQYHIKFRGSHQVHIYSELELISTIAAKVGTRLYDGHICTIDDYEIWELVPRKAKVTMEIV